ncbi:hypothetical protein NDU88_003190 [Pleurodeles waltl]|uniref:Gypsy retrotransposon integrase-like protein 1 n=1 Tax=Pleurodeles waltl TaxID=8319 RepID=A0AAV7W1E9_PLEWA|nr:hypothetical protein NDU88_003190 [Pleurodeles waltl]
MCSVTSSIVEQDEWKKAVAEDKVLQQVCENIRFGLGHNAKQDKDLCGYWKVKDELSVEDGFLLRGLRLVVPVVLREKIIGLGHDGHQGMSRTKARIRLDYWWPGVDLMVERVVRECADCCNSDKVYQTRVPPMCIRDMPQKPWEVVAVEIVGPVHGRGGTNYLIVLIDQFSGWAEIGMCGTTETKKIIEFFKDIFGREGLPNMIVTDNGLQFVLREMKDFLEKCGVRHKRCSPYHPEGNGTVERFDRCVKECIQLETASSRDWRDGLKRFLYAYRVTPHSTTGKVPFDLFRSRKANTSLAPAWVSWRKNNIEQESVVNVGNEYERVSVQKRKMYYDNKKGTHDYDVKIGDQILVKKPTLCKDRSKFLGPFEVVKL